MTLVHLGASVTGGAGAVHGEEQRCWLHPCLSCSQASDNTI